ncbi:hypothetical protein A3C52_02900 [Candidatus Peribacteria bacterium RIFCSPHIGHO2_02_FULL_51_15]|nr:MAG: hypothetical protein A3C52_02900 [Candidatus Peribacteria bacterium RIFCSPHIGHO2_02_FULL_51_15]
MKISRLTYGFLISFVIAVFLLQWWQSPHSVANLWFSISGAGICSVVMIFFRRREIGFLSLAICAGVSAAFIAVIHSAHVTTNRDIESFADGKKMTLLGRVADMPDRRPDVTKYKIQVTAITRGKVKKEVTGNVLVNDKNGWPRYRYGDQVKVSGTLEPPGKIEDFDYGAYLSLSDIYAIVPWGRIEAVPAAAKTGTISKIFSALFGLRETAEGWINRVQTEPHASLLSGLLTGSRRGIPENLTASFRTAGLSHIVAISGYNVTIILALLSGLLFWLPIKARFPFLLIGIVAFTIFVGAGSTVVRAAIMGILGLAALESGRLPAMRLSILWTAFFMLIFRPAFIWDDAGFQLSFLAVIGIAGLGAPLKKILNRVPESFGLRKALVATLAAQIATLPLTVFLFRQISLVAPFSNIIVAPLIPAAMLLGFIGAILGAVYWPLGLAVSYPAWAFLEIIIKIATWSAAIPWAAIKF